MDKMETTVSKTEAKPDAVEREGLTVVERCRKELAKAWAELKKECPTRFEAVLH